MKDLNLSEAEQAQLQNSINRKDSEQIKQQGGIHSDSLAILLKATGSIEEALAVMETLPLQNRQELNHLIKTYRLIKQTWPNLSITLDPLENRGFAYYTGLSFTIYSKTNSSELGRGGRYLTINKEEAVGATLYIDAILDLFTPTITDYKLYVPTNTSLDLITKFHQQGYITIKALDDDHLEQMAKTLGCTHLLVDDKITEL